LGFLIPVNQLDKKLLKQIRRGDKKAFRSVFDLYFNALAAFGYKYVPDFQAVEDMVQEAFISFWEGRDKFDHLNAVKSFLYTAVRNKCLNHLKHQSVRRKHEDSLVYSLESDQYFDSHVIEEETFNQLFAEIRNLPASSREIMLLALNGLKNQEIADELEISINTVKTQKKIAYAKIKDAMGPMATVMLLVLMA
jgi:RNA polymerase sigma-70 factor (ECF subfamily)